MKYSKYKEQACDRCGQIAEDLDSIEKTGKVQKSKTDDEKLLDNEKSIRINETNSINSSNSIGMISFSGQKRTPCVQTIPIHIKS